MVSCSYLMKWMLDNGMRVVGPLFVLLAVTLIGGVIYVLLFDLIPYYTENISPYAGMVLLGITILLSTNIFFNYYMIVVTPPGHTPEVDEAEANKIEQLMRQEAGHEIKKGEGFSRFCKFCKKAKPPRSHHCHICKSCVLRMDHHCPWVNNCVGFYNHKYFVLFLLYLWCGCGFVAITSLIPFRASTDYRAVFVGSRTMVLFAFVISISVFLALSLLLGWHIYLVFTGQTTIEFYYNRTKARHARMRGEVHQNEYDLGSAKNWNIFFGPGRFWFSWLLPTTKASPGDGIVYLTRSEHLRKSGVNHHFV